MVGIYALTSFAPLTGEVCDNAGVMLYMCAPLCDFEHEPTHYLSVVGIREGRPSDAVDLLFQAFPAYGIYSYQWLTYYMEG